jgi:hypothetical protein
MLRNLRLGSRQKIGLMLSHASLTFDPSSPSSCLMGFPVIFFFFFPSKAFEELSHVVERTSVSVAIDLVEVILGFRTPWMALIFSRIHELEASRFSIGMVFTGPMTALRWLGECFIIPRAWTSVVRRRPSLLRRREAHAAA